MAITGAITAGVGSLAGAGASLISGGQQAGAAKNATQAQMNMYNQTRQDLLPYMNAGQSAFGNLSAMMGTGGPQASANMLAGLQNYPGYQWALSQGQTALDRSAASKGLLLSGGQLKDSQAYGQGMGNQLFNQMYQQQMGIAGLGENAAAMTGQAGTSAGYGMANTITQGGVAQSAGTMGAANNLFGQNSALSNALLAYQMQGNGSGGETIPWNVGPTASYGDLYSDRRLKTNITRIGKLDSGLPVYQFRYKGSALPQIGVMAQDVEKVAPHAVRRDPQTGFKRVNYGAVSALPPMKKAA